MSPLEEGHVGMVRRVCRMVLGLDPSEGALIGGAGPREVDGAPLGGRGGLPSAGTATADDAGDAKMGERKVKLAMVLDQADDSEVKPLPASALRRMIQEWKTLENDGEDPVEEEEATGDQLTALDFRVRSGLTPYADFA
eukprot:1170737-Karenia_brevis.AAC.1